MKNMEMPEPGQALQGRQEKIQVADSHFVNGHNLQAPFPAGLEQALFAMGRFWGVERRFWQLEGVYSTAVGYAGGYTYNPTYKELCTGMTGHAEVVRVIFDPVLISYESLLKVFWESHNPTQGMQQGNDVGTQYRSAIYTFNAQQGQRARNSLKQYQQKLSSADKGLISTELRSAPEFYFAESEHQQYLAKNPNEDCRLSGLGICFDDKLTLRE